MTTPGEIKGMPTAPKPGEWAVSYNNGEPFTVEATNERGAIVAGLAFLGITAPVHPIRAWPIKEQS